MINELELKLNEINTEIESLKGDFSLDSADYLGRVQILESMKEWLEGMITNYCD